MKNARSTIIDAVLASIEDITGVPSPRIRFSDRLIGDLKMHGDDFSLVFVPDVEEATGLHADPEAWSQVSTVQQAIDLLIAASDRRLQTPNDLSQNA